MKHISRKEWGAQPPPKGKFDKLNRARVAGVVIHHSGVQNGPKGSDAVKAFERHHMGNATTWAKAGMVLATTGL